MNRILVRLINEGIIKLSLELKEQWDIPYELVEVRLPILIDKIIIEEVLSQETEVFKTGR